MREQLLELFPELDSDDIEGILEVVGNCVQDLCGAVMALALDNGYDEAEVEELLGQIEFDGSWE